MIRQRVAILLLSTGFWLTAQAQQPTLIPAPPSIAATAYLLLDTDSGKVLVEHNADERVAPASLTKLMTDYVLSFELAKGNVSNDDMVTVSNNAWSQNPVFQGSSLMWIETGKQVRLGDLHRGIVISSGNDASVAVAEHLAGSESAFADVMNQHAVILGMTNSHFVNAHGLPHPDHYTTARDLALLARAMTHFPESYALYSEKEFTYNGITQTNRNRLLWRDPSVDGLKTGHTQEAGYCLVASAIKGGMRLVSVVMGTDSEGARERETQNLLAYGFRYYETQKVYDVGAEISRTQVWAGEANELALGVSEPIYLTIPRGQHDDVKAVMNVDEIIKAPVKSGHEYGTLVISLNGETLAERPLVALSAVAEGGFFKRFWHTLVLFFNGLFGR